MSAVNYTYFVTIGAVETQVYPGGDWSLKIAKAEEDFSFCKDYRIKFEGEFVFAGDDYALLMDADCCDKIDLRIKCNDVDYWFGYFSYPYDFEVDEDICTITGTPEPLDKYYYFDMFADNKWQIAATDSLTYPNNFPALPRTYEADCIDCEPIMDILQDFCDAALDADGGKPIWPVGMGRTAISTFFNNDPFPDLTDPYPDGAGAINYVTTFLNKLNHVVMAMARDVCDPAVGGTEWPEWSWNDLMEKIHSVWNTWWYVDEQGDVRVEHISFWDLYFPVSYNLTTLDGGHWIGNSSKYDYRSEEMPREEDWKWSDMMYDFWPMKFTYYNCFIPGGKSYIKEYSLSNLVTNIEYIGDGINNFAVSPDCADISESDYMLIRCIPKAEAPGAPPACSDYVAWYCEYDRDGTDRVNAHLSPSNLLINYWVYDRPFWFGDLRTSGGVVDTYDVNFNSTWKTLRQVEITFPVCCNEASTLITGSVVDNPRYLYEFGIIFNDLITTQYGEGELYTGSIDNGMLSLQLIFEDLRCKKSPTDWFDASEL